MFRLHLSKNLIQTCILYLLTKVPFSFGYFRNANKIVALLGNGIEPSLIPQHINLTQVSQVSADDYHHITEILRGVKEDNYEKLGLESCSIEDELNKVQQEKRKIATKYYYQFCFYYGKRFKDRVK